jgi:phenylalanyl-tRNA synthetase alpha chain
MTDTIPQLSAYDDATLDASFATLAADVQTSATSTDPEAFRLLWLGRKQGRLKLISEAWLKSAPADARKPLGMRFNQLKQQIEAALEAPAHSAAKPFALPASRIRC